jgi:protein-S-isoprenylcysteine O-methyltransferase Ste14
MGIKIFEEMQKRVIPPVLLLCLIALQIISMYISIPSIIFYVSIAFMVAGLVIMIASILILKEHKTSWKHFEKPSMLVVHSLFSYSRNPIYVGMLFLLIGVSIICFTPISAILVIAFYNIMNNYYIPIEERDCVTAFGDEYQSYCKNTPRWLLCKND